MLKSDLATDDAIARSGLIHRVYRPAERVKPLPTLLMVHGRAGTAEVMWTFSKLIEQIKPLVIAPQAPLPDPIGGWSWWMVGEDKRRVPELSVIHTATSKVAKFIDILPELYGADPQNIVAIGFSQGAAVVSSLMLQSPERFLGVGILAGFVPSTARDAFVSNGKLPPLFVAHGSQDETVPIRYAEDARDFFVEQGADVEFIADDTGHKVGSKGMKALGVWLNRQFSRSPSPDR